MGVFPLQPTFADSLVNISTLSPQSVGSIMNTSSPFDGTASWPTANLAIFVPFRIARPFTFNSLFCYNGTAVAGNFDLGVYTADGTRIISTGSTAQSVTNIIQSVSVSSTEIGPGQFYFALAASSTSANYYEQGANTGITQWNLQVIGLAQMASAFPLPSTATFAALTVRHMPLIGISGRSFV